MKAWKWFLKQQTPPENDPNINKRRRRNRQKNETTHEKPDKRKTHVETTTKGKKEKKKQISNGKTRILPKRQNKEERTKNDPPGPNPKTKRNKKTQKGKRVGKKVRKRAISKSRNSIIVLKLLLLR